MTYLPEPYPTLADFIAKIKEWGFTEQAGVGLTRRNDARKFSASKPYHGVIKLPCRGDLGRCAQTHINTVCMILRVKPKEFWAGPQAEDTPVLPRVAPAPTAVSSNRLDIHVVPTPTSDTASEDGPEAVTETVTGAANESVMALAPIAASRPDPLPVNSREIYERCFPKACR